MNKKGQAMGVGLLTGMIVAVMVFIMMSAFLPTIIEMIGMGKGSNSANCVNYVDPNGLYSYNESLDTDSITCSILNFTPGLYVLSIVFAIISGIISGRIAGSMGQQEYGYQQYG
jgi:hypothetical protein